jgi:hypothetical protein
MYENVDRRAGWSQSGLSCITRPTSYVRCQIRLWDPLVCVYLSTFVYRSFTDLVTWRVWQCHKSFYLIIIIIIIHYIIYLRFNWVIRIWLSVFSVCLPYSSYEFYSDLLYYYLAAYLRSQYVRRVFSFDPWLAQRKLRALIWPLVGTESLIFIITLFFHLWIVIFLYSVRPFFMRFNASKRGLGDELRKKDIESF